MDEKIELNVSQVEQQREENDGRIAFNPDDWEEVPLSFLNSKTSNKEEQIAQNTVNESENIASEKTDNMSKVAKDKVVQCSQSQQQIFLLEYGKKFQKYKKYKQYEQYFHDKYEKNLYFDPEEEIFITPDGIQFDSIPGNQVGTSLLFDSSNKKMIGISNLAFNLELSTTNKALQDQIEQNNIQQESQLISDPLNNNASMGQSGLNRNIERDSFEGGSLNQGSKMKSNNNLESIFDWIEKKDKLNKKRIQKQNKNRVASQKESNNQNESIGATGQQKKQRSLPMNYFLRKIEK